jgi:hypothetical protein
LSSACSGGDTFGRAGRVADFNRDGILDLAVVNQGTVSILLGNGDGSFQAPQSYFASPSGAGSLAVGDFNGDGALDLAAASPGSAPDSILSTVSILLGNGDRSFQAAQSYLVGIDGGSVAVADFNGDRILDLAVANCRAS